MSRRIHQLLLAGCVLIGVLQAPAAYRSALDGWQGAYGSEAPRGLAMESAVSARSIQADAKSELDVKKSGSLEENSAAVVRAGF